MSASGAVGSGLIPIPVEAMTLKLVFTASLLDAQHHSDSVKNKPASLLVPLGKAISGIPAFWCGRHMSGFMGGGGGPAPHQNFQNFYKFLFVSRCHN